MADVARVQKVKSKLKVARAAAPTPAAVPTTSTAPVDAHPASDASTAMAGMPRKRRRDAMSSATEAEVDDASFAALPAPAAPPGATTSTSIPSSTSSAPAEPVSFASLGLDPSLVDACGRLHWSAPTRIQAESIPLSLSGRDIIALAETGSGKTAAFALPILHALIAAPSRPFALILAPTRELAFQIAEQVEALGSGVGVKCVVLVGGVDSMSQAIALAKRPHIVVGTPGRVLDHLQNTKGFSLRGIRYLVLDEADRMLSLDFEEAINGILTCLPRDRRTMLFSATMTSKVAKLQRASLRDPVRVEVSSKYATVAALVQHYLFVPAKYKDAYAVYVLNEFSGGTVIVFAATCAAVAKASFMLNNLGFAAVCLHGQMSQPKRLAALARFKEGHKSILVATDVASRGLDIPSVDVVLNLDVPANAKDYIHRVGRTARAGRGGRAVTIVTQYDIELYQRIEALLGTKLDAFPAPEEAALMLAPRVSEAQRVAAADMRDAGFTTDGKADGGADDADDEEAMADPAVALKRSRHAGGRGSSSGRGRRGGRGRGRGGR